MSRGIRLTLSLMLFAATFAALPTVTSTQQTTAQASITITDCTEAAFDQALADIDDGGTITFDCPAGTTIVIDAEKVIAKTVTIDGAGDVTFDGEGEVRLFHVQQDGDLTLENLSLTGGFDTDVGGAVYNEGLLRVHNSSIIGNTAWTLGGAIFSSGNIYIVDSTISGNGGVPIAGGALLLTETGTGTVLNSTFSGNTAAHVAGAVANYGNLTIVNSTFAGNETRWDNPSTIVNGSRASTRIINSTIAGGGPSGGASTAIKNGGGDLTITGSIVVDNQGDNCAGTITTGGYNLSDDTSCGFTDTGDLQGADVDALLGDLLDNGGPTITMLPAPGSPAIDRVPTAICTDLLDEFGAPADQRGEVRPTGSGCDSGSVEVTYIDLTLDTCTEPAFDAALGDLRAADGGSLTLDCPPETTITFTDANSPKNIDKQIAINTINPLILSGGGTTRLFDVQESGNLTLKSLTLAHGSALAGGAIRNLGGRITILNSTLLDNHADETGGAIVTREGSVTIADSTVAGNSAGAGGAIWLVSGVLDVSGSTFEGNTALAAAGAILAFTVIDMTLDVTNSTFTANSAGSDGGAIALASNVSAANATIVSSTFSGNTTGGSGTAISNDTSLPVQTTTITANVFASDSGANCSGAPLESGGYNLADDGSCGFTETSDIQNEDPRLGPLADNGGPTQTMMPAAPSDAINAIPADFCAQHLPTTDQRGVSRPQLTRCDIGAVEVEISKFPQQVVCANRYNGDLRMPRRSSCASTEIRIELPADGPVDLCVNRYNGDARYSRSRRCSSTEFDIQVIGDRSQPVCVNRYNGGLRVPRSAGRCASTEIAQLI